MIASEIRKGAIIIFNKIPHRVMDFQHRTPGNLRAFVQAKLRNLVTGNQTEAKFASTDTLEEADARTTGATFLYADGTGYTFMMNDSYEQMTLTEALVAEAKYYLQDQMPVDLTIWEGEPIAINLPQTVVLTVAETSPEIRGATASNSPKPAITNTGLSINVPPFIKQGERVLVRTEDGAYISRAEAQ